ncbi:Hypothetical Protein FCC1311_076302 [Hondaea fermentalgiana]|uniref:4-hydroxy-4-methyl-2-oxoglutarate aldolase n=1 Tax=Hondaea fermentalgiana TaxID=2315210 RepID=A0A2R5GKH0_9STRA|nr:Hypothetical Protein FCC1311_076302 [Hondaea fermentalgiana]|eukprot:GBG31406.1 Hypothetical Protein FCC1311_076302 [Hondaea fermentalgiana]
MAGSDTRGTLPATADLCDELEDALQYAQGGLLRDFGGHVAFGGRISTVQCLEDNSKVKEAVAENGKGRVLVIDGGASMQRALVGDQIAIKAAKNGWQGIVVNGCIRDSAAIAKVDIGVKAIGTIPRKTEKRGSGVRDVPVSFAGVLFRPGDVLVADEDGIVVSSNGDLDAKL